MTLGERIQQLRKGQGLSQEALAEHIGVSRQAVSKWEKGQTYPDTENLLALAALFKVSADDLAGLRRQEEKDEIPAASDLTGRVPGRRPVSWRTAAITALLAGMALAILLVPAAIFLVLRDAGTGPEDSGEPIVDNGGGDEDIQPQDPAREESDAARTVYIALQALLYSADLSAEEQYQHRQDIYSNLQYLSWREFGQLGEAGKSDETRLELLQWLQEQESLSREELLGLLAGGCRADLDGWLTDDYCTVLAGAFLAYPEPYVKLLAGPEFTDEEREILTGHTVYGCEVPEDVYQAALTAIDELVLRSGALCSDGEKAWGWELYDRLHRLSGTS